MSLLDQLFQQFLRERTYINNVTASTREWYECAWKAFTAAQKVAPERDRAATLISRINPLHGDIRAMVISCLALVLCSCGSSPAAPTLTSAAPAPAPSAPVSAARVTLSGHVSDVDTAAPIAGAVVSIVDTPGGDAA